MLIKPDELVDICVERNFEHFAHAELNHFVMIWSEYALHQPEMTRAINFGSEEEMLEIW